MASLDFAHEKENFKEYYSEYVSIFEEASESLRTLLSLLLTDNDEFPTPRVLSRVKTRDECINKFARKYQAKCEEAKIPYEIRQFITDIVGLRVICLYETDISAARQVLLDNFELIAETDKSRTVEYQEDVFGYKGLHIDLKLKENRRELPEYRRFKDQLFEVQLRTIVQDAWSSVDHRIKYKKSIPHMLSRRINRLAALFELADQEFVNIRDETDRLELHAKGQVHGAVVIEPLSAIGQGNLKADAKVMPDADLTPARLDAFSFLQLAAALYPGYPFSGRAIDGFVNELLTLDPALTAEQITQAVQSKNGILEHYRSYQYDRYLNRLNPFTTIRHALYLSDKDKFKPILFDLQRKNFDEWLVDKKLA